MLANMADLREQVAVALNDLESLEMLGYDGEQNLSNLPVETVNPDTDARAWNKRSQ